MEVKTESGGTFNAAGQGTTALGIIGTVLGGLATTMAGGTGLGLLNNNNNKVEYATKQDLAYSQELARKDSEISLLKSEQNTEIKMTEVYKQAHSEIAAVRDTVNANNMAQQTWNSQQAVNNATMSAAIATNTNSINALANTLGNITQTIVPKSAVCPSYMNEFNSWTAPTA